MSCSDPNKSHASGAHHFRGIVIPCVSSAFPGAGITCYSNPVQCLALAMVGKPFIRSGPIFALVIRHRPDDARQFVEHRDRGDLPAAPLDELPGPARQAIVTAVRIANDGPGARRFQLSPGEQFSMISPLDKLRPKGANPVCQIHGCFLDPQAIIRDGSC